MMARDSERGLALKTEAQVEAIPPDFEYVRFQSLVSALHNWLNASSAGLAKTLDAEDRSDQNGDEEEEDEDGDDNEDDQEQAEEAHDNFDHAA
ncbi:hypothetical protein FRC00_008751, partial [Tulasnella sp. 408]